MGKFNDLVIRHNRFVQPSNMKLHIAQAIESVDTQLVNMNKSNMLNSKDAFDNPLINKQTGSEFLSNLYAIRTRKTKPNLFLKGGLQNQMFMQVNENNLTYFIDSLDEKSGIITGNYGLGIYGVPIRREPEAKRLTGPAFAKLYKKKVLLK